MTKKNHHTHRYAKIFRPPSTAESGAHGSGALGSRGANFKPPTGTGVFIPTRGRLGRTGQTSLPDSPLEADRLAPTSKARRGSRRSWLGESAVPAAHTTQPPPSAKVHPIGPIMEPKSPSSVIHQPRVRPKINDTDDWKILGNQSVWHITSLNRPKPSPIVTNSSLHQPPVRPKITDTDETEGGVCWWEWAIFPLSRT